MKPNIPDRPAEILLVEDNQEDVFLTKACFAGLPHRVNFHHVENGEDCIRFLERSGRYCEAPRPDLIFLDLNMPRMDGRAVMARIAADERLRLMPVIILTTSAAAEDVRQMYELRCSSYIVKPMSFDPFQEAIRVVADYWLSVVTLPEKD